MPSTTRLHHGVANAILPEAYLVFPHPLGCPPPNGGFNPDADRRNRAIRRVLRWGEFPPTRCFLRLDPGDPGEDNALEAHILVEATAVWPGIALQLGQLRIIGLPFVRGTPEAKGTGLLEHDEVLE